MQYIFPSIAGNPETYALVGMGAMLAAVIRAPKSFKDITPVKYPSSFTTGK